MSQSTGPQSKGRVARQTHVGVPAGLVEEEHGRDAFAGPVSHLYRTAPPTAWVDVDGPLRPLAFDLNRLDVPAEGRTLVLHNDDLTVSVSRLAAPMPFANRNGDADEIVYVREGSGELQTDYGPLAFAAQDYLVLPRGTAQPLRADRAVLALRDGVGRAGDPARLRAARPARRGRPRGC